MNISSSFFAKIFIIFNNNTQITTNVKSLLNNLLNTTFMTEIKILLIYYFILFISADLKIKVTFSFITKVLIKLKL